jgi:hypothetical protein
MPRGVGLNWRYDEARLQRRLWTPSPEIIRRGLNLDAEKNITVVSGAVSQWNDSDGLWSFTQSTAGLRPAYQAGGWNNTPSVGFTAATQRLAGTASFTPLVNTTAFTAFAVINQTATGWFFEHGPTSPTARTGLVVIGADLLGVLNGETIGTTIATNTNYIIVWRFDGNASTKSILRVNGVLAASGGITAATTTSTGALFVGFGPDPNTFRGRMRDLLILPYAATDRQIELIEGYLYWKNGRLVETPPASHPFANRPPLIGD